MVIVLLQFIVLHVDTMSEHARTKKGFSDVVERIRLIYVSLRNHLKQGEIPSGRNSPPARTLELFSRHQKLGVDERLV